MRVYEDFLTYKSGALLSLITRAYAGVGFNGSTRPKPTPKRLPPLRGFRAMIIFTGCSVVRRPSTNWNPAYAIQLGNKSDGRTECYLLSLLYATGVYQHVTGDYLGMLSVRMIGWGLYRGQGYWLLANSWGTSWGEKGFFKIRRFVNECWIENYRYAGDPDLPRQ